MDKSAQRIIGIVSFFAVFGVVGYLVLNEKKDELPEAVDIDETEMEKRASVVEAFDSQAAPLDGPHAKAINTMFTNLGKAFTDRNTTDLKNYFDLPMTLAVVKHQGMLPDELKGKMDKGFMDMMTDQYISSKSERSSYMDWEHHEVRSVRFIKGEGEAVVYVRHRDSDGIWTKMRWWITRRAGPWKVYDFEDLSINLRQSTLMGIGFQAASRGATWPSRLPAFQGLVDAIMREDMSTAEYKLKELEVVQFPPALQAVILLLKSSVERYQERYDNALKALDEASALGFKMPSIHYLRAGTLVDMKRFDEALKASELYIQELGADMDIWVIMSDAHNGLGNQKEAEDFALKALKDDPQAIEAVLSLALALPANRASDIAPHYGRLKDFKTSFPVLAMVYEAQERKDALNAMVKAFDATYPDQGDVTAPYKTEPEAPLPDDGGGDTPP